MEMKISLCKRARIIMNSGTKVILKTNFSALKYNYKKNSTGVEFP
jgi:hypothetical protein